MVSSFNVLNKVFLNLGCMAISGAEFVFTAGEQLFFQEKQFTNDPKHCKRCISKRNSGRGFPSSGHCSTSVSPGQLGTSRTAHTSHCTPGMRAGEHP